MHIESTTINHFSDDEDGDAEKKQREHLLALNQVIARQVMEKSRMVAGNFFSAHLKELCTFILPTKGLVAPPCVLCTFCMHDLLVIFVDLFQAPERQALSKNPIETHFLF